jgi:hypothetical protein
MEIKLVDRLDPDNDDKRAEFDVDVMPPTHAGARLHFTTRDGTDVEARPFRVDVHLDGGTGGGWILIEYERLGLIPGAPKEDDDAE